MHKLFVSSLFILGCFFVSCSQRAPVVIHEVPVYKKTILIAIDPGHGGNDFGTASPRKTMKEKDLTLTTAYMLRDHLKQMGYVPFLTRSRDTFIPLDNRAQIANQKHATLFISIHYNAAKNLKARGIEIFYCTPEDYPKRSAHSRLLAQDILNAMIQETKAPSRGVKARNFAVLRNTRMPAVLIEGGFLTNSIERSKLDNPKYLNSIALGIANGINNYLSQFGSKGHHHAKR